MLFRRLVHRIVDKRMDESSKEILEKVDITLKETVSQLEARLEARLDNRLSELNKKVLDVKELRDITNKDLQTFKFRANTLRAKIFDLLK